MRTYSYFEVETFQFGTLLRSRGLTGFSIYVEHEKTWEFWADANDPPCSGYPVIRKLKIIPLLRPESCWTLSKSRKMANQGRISNTFRTDWVKLRRLKSSSGSRDYWEETDGSIPKLKISLQGNQFWSSGSSDLSQKE